MNMEPDDAERWARFGRALAEAMPKSRLRTQKALAQHLNVDQTMVSAWQRGLKLGRMSRARAEKIERALGPEACPPGALVSILFGPSAAEAPAPQIEDRLDAIERTLAEQGETMAQILAAITAADRRLRDQGT